MIESAHASNTGYPSMPPLEPVHVDIIESHGGKIVALDPIGASVHGIDLAA